MTATEKPSEFCPWTVWHMYGSDQWLVRDEDMVLVAAFDNREDARALALDHNASLLDFTVALAEVPA